MSFVEIETDDAIHAIDAEGEPEPPGVSVTPGFDGDDVGPSRVTIWVPEEHTVLSMGAPVRTPKALQSADGTIDRVKTVDAGFVAQTDTHLHLLTWGVDPDGSNALPARTVVRLGKPLSVVTAGPDYGTRDENAYPPILAGHPPEKASVGSAYAPPYNVWEGYAMITEGAAHHESVANHMLVSSGADVRIAAQRAVLVGSAGDVFIMAGAEDDTTSIVKNFTDENDPSDGGNWVIERQEWKDFDFVMTNIGTAQSALSAVLTVAWARYFRPAVAGQPGWESFGITDYVAAATAVAAAGLSGVLTALAGKDLARDTDPGSTVNLYGAASVNVYGKSGATVHSDLSATLSGEVAATVSAGLSASLSSLVSASVSGTLASMSGLVSASVTSMMGSATVTGKTKAQLSSAGQVFVAADGDVQVDSMEGNLFLHGKKQFSLISGGGDGVEGSPKPFGTGFAGRTYTGAPGWAVVGTTTGITLGAVSNADGFAKPQFSGRVLTIDDRGIAIETAQTNFTCDDKGVKFDAKRIQLG